VDSKIRTLTTSAVEGTREGLANLLTRGGVFLKFGRYGKPHLNHVFVTGDLKHIQWRRLTKETSRRKAAIDTTQMQRVQVGRNSKPFQRFPNPNAGSYSFTIQCKHRSLDLELASTNDVNVDVWVNAFTALMEDKLTKEDVLRYVQLHHERKK
jgi:hypothetical protein